MRPRALFSTLALALVVAAHATAACAQTQGPSQPQAAPRLDVPYVPTHEKVVDEMLRLARPGKDDVLYDLGSGDGRIVITAARRFGSRGVGYDIDPERVAEARDNAKKAGVTDRVRFEQQDIFTADIKEATIVTLYLLPDVNLRLRPKLLSELRPGTRIVSHNYDMGDWKPERVVKVTVPGGGEHTVYYWTIPSR